MLRFALKNCTALAIVLAFVTVACGQSRGTVAKESELSVSPKFIGKAGEIQKFLISEKDLPAASTLPHGFNASKLFLVKTDSIGAGDVALTASVQTESRTEFEKVRILRLGKSELNPNGWAWTDCTVTTEKLERSDDPNLSEERLARIRKYLPDFSRKSVSCLTEPLKNENYFALAVQVEPSPTVKFSDFRFSVETVEGGAGKFTYRLSFKNIGHKTISELNFVSSFDSDTQLVSFSSEHATCKRSEIGNSLGSVACYIKDISPDHSVAIDLVSAPSELGNSSTSEKANQGWTIFGVLKEHPNSFHRPLNLFILSPLDK